MMNKPVFYKRILHDFLQRFDGTDHVIVAALADKRRDEARRQAHSTKGLAASIGAAALSDAATILETTLKTDAACDVELAAFSRELTIVIDGLRTAFTTH
jgi:two-component system sensor histidine kinase/response regulator